MKLINHVLDIRRLIQQAFDPLFSHGTSKGGCYACRADSCRSPREAKETG